MPTTARVAAAAGPVHRARAPRNDLLVGAVVIGVLAGAAAIAWVALSTAVAGQAAWRPLAVIATPFLGGEARDGGAAAVLCGGILWCVISAALALLYAAVIPRDFPFASSAMMGVGYSIVVMAIMTTLVLPRVNPLMRAEMPAIGGAWVLAYVVYGLGLGFIPLVRRRLFAA